jgi:hypothetical protein
VRLACLRWVSSGHPDLPYSTSALDRLADMEVSSRRVGFGPRTHALHNLVALDHLIGAAEFGRLAVQRAFCVQDPVRFLRAAVCAANWCFG